MGAGRATSRAHARRARAHARTGEGSYGKVLLCRDSRSDTRFAVKQINRQLLQRKGRLSTSSPLADVATEIAIMKKLVHPNVVRLHEVIDDPRANAIYMVTEYCVNGPVLEGARSTALPEGLARKYFRDIVTGLHYLHAQGIAHRDLKPENLLLDSENRAKLSDFGVSTVTEGELAVAKGTPAFMAPEVLLGDVYDGYRADVWSLGATLYQFVTGHPPFQAKNEIEVRVCMRACVCACTCLLTPAPACSWRSSCAPPRSRWTTRTWS